MSNKNLFSTLSHYLTENHCRPTNNFEGKGLKNYGYDFFSAIVCIQKIPTLSKTIFKLIEICNNSYN